MNTQGQKAPGVSDDQEHQMSGSRTGVPGLKEHVPTCEGFCGEGQGATGDLWLAEVQSPQEGQDE